MYSQVMEGNMGWVAIEEDGWRKGPWTAEEDKLLIEYVRMHGEGRWNSAARLAGLRRNGKSCRLRWVNYLRPDLKKGQITPQEESIILDLHARWGNRWSTIARSLPGRTDNEIKNYWRTHFKKKAKSPSNASEKAKNRSFRRQQKYRQQQQQLKPQQIQQQQQQQQQLQYNLDMKAITDFLEENDHSVSCISQETQEMASMYPNIDSSRRQQKYRQQQQQLKPQQIQQQQQQQLQYNLDMKATTDFLEENDHSVSCISQETQEMASMYPNTPEQQGYFYSLLNGGNVTAPESSNEEILWDGLWNLDDVFCNSMQLVLQTNPASMHNLVAPFC